MKNNNIDILLSRDTFREAVFERDRGRCVLCGMEGQDAHHIMERRLWPDGGYYLRNGATVCGTCHLRCERTLVQPSELWTAIGVEPMLPPHLYADQQYTKWGDPILPNGTRMIGELFHEEAVQKALTHGDCLHLYIEYVKYPRTWHLPHTEKMGSDDRKLDAGVIESWEEVVCSVKMDGENTTKYPDHIHARSINSANHPTQSWVKGMLAGVGYDIPKGWRLCGENLQGLHTIKYDGLPTYFMLISIWDDKNVCLSWDETLEWADLLGLSTVPVFYRGPYDKEAIHKAWQDHHGFFEGTIKMQDGTEVPGKKEGYVVRTSSEFRYADFKRSVGKFVAQDFVIREDEEHWAQRKVEFNKLKQ